MGDSVCLARSFSQPADTSSHEVIPRGVLTESVSFGRFASETLQWAKWSAFTQNRYLEEVERFTKPGSVAEKKAFFEAHFKNRASGNTTKTKKTQEVQKENLVDSEVPLVSEVRRGDVVCSAVKISHETVCEVPEENLVDSEVTCIEVSSAEMGSVAPSVSVTDAISEKFDSVVVPEDEDLDKENSTSLSKERHPSSSSGSKTNSRSSIPESSFSVALDLPLKKARKEPLSTRKRSTNVSRNQSRSPPQPFHMSINCAPTDNSGKKMHQSGSRSSTKVKDALKADKERSGPSSVHMPLNSATSTRQTTKTAPKRLARRSTTQETSSSNAGTSAKPKGNEPTVASKGRKRPLSRGAKEDSDVPKCSTRFFKKVEEKKKKEDAVKEQSSCGFKEHQEFKNPQVGGFQAPMISLTSPSVRRNQTPGRENIQKSRESPQKVASVKTTNARNPTTEKYKRCKIHPSLTKKKTQEDSSPNNGHQSEFGVYKVTETTTNTLNCV
ncbi:hypothetical protein Bca101_051342 [Brassica carinata]